MVADSVHEDGDGLLEGDEDLWGRVGGWVGEWREGGWNELLHCTTWMNDLYEIGRKEKERPTHPPTHLPA